MDLLRCHMSLGLDLHQKFFRVAILKFWVPWSIPLGETDLWAL